jgi:hypothetical protein
MSYQESEGFHLIGTRIDIAMMLNWTLEMGERMPVGVSWLRSGSCYGLSGYGSKTPSYVKVTRFIAI